MEPLSFAYESMGTHWEVSFWESVEDIDTLRRDILRMSDEFDTTYSRFIETSLVSQLASQRGTIKVPHDFIKMLKIYIKLYELSHHKFTPLVGKTLSDMGYDPSYYLKSKVNISTVPQLHKAVTIKDDTHIELNDPVLFDFGALGKGYFVEKIKNKLLESGYKHFLVNGSGDIAFIGQDSPIQVGLEHPHDITKVIGTVQLYKGAMCSSGGNRRTWGKYHHIIDPQLLTSPTDILASWVIADTATIADALATALFLSPPEAFKNDFQFEYLLLNKEMKVKRSPGFTAQLF